MKIVFLLCLISATSTLALAQDRLLTRNGSVSFHSKTSLETIDADTQTAASLLDKKSGEVEFSVLIKSFTFQKALMQEHFNETYLESDKFPKSVFKGKVDDIAKVDFSKDGTYPLNVAGQLSIHGVTRDITAPVIISIQNGIVHANTSFAVTLSDYKIVVPSLVLEKVSKTVNINVNLKYESQIQP